MHGGPAQRQGPEHRAQGDGEANQDAQGPEVRHRPAVGEPPGDVAGPRVEAQAAEELRKRQGQEGLALPNQAELPAREAVVPVWPRSEEEEHAGDQGHHEQEEGDGQQQHGHGGRQRVLRGAWCRGRGGYEDIARDQPVDAVAADLQDAHADRRLAHVGLDGHHEVEDDEQQGGRAHQAVQEDEEERHREGWVHGDDRQDGGHLQQQAKGHELPRLHGATKDRPEGRSNGEPQGIDGEEDHV
mmetsp:Transcript_69525/g.207163  ORF Transcript_69525/g.207163 Transcript_69525/m.207163 type:complete len:242 (+) Transcript_69525:2903-3628(+)